MKNIVILNGSTRRQGRTDTLTQAFIVGATRAGHQVREIFTADLPFNGTLYSNDIIAQNPYQLDDILGQDGAIGDFYRAIYQADIVVFASPIYWWNVSGSLKQAVDYIQPLQQAVGWQKFIKSSALLLVAGGEQFDLPLAWYAMFEKYLGWQNLGVVTGADKLAEAEKLGEGL